MEPDRRIDSTEDILEALAMDAPERYREALIDADVQEPIKALVLARDADEYGRSAGIAALALLAA